MHCLHPRRLDRRPPRRALALAPVGRRWLCVLAESLPTIRLACLEARGAAELEGQGHEQRRVTFFEQLDRKLGCWGAQDRYRQVRFLHP